MSQPDLSALLEKAREAQEKLQTVQRDLSSRTVEGSAGGGMVTAVAGADPSFGAENSRPVVGDVLVPPMKNRLWWALLPLARRKIESPG